MQNIRKKHRAQILQAECVACGCCQKVCPMNAITIERGVFATVESLKCVGCGKCAKECPANVISIVEVPV